MVAQYSKGLDRDNEGLIGLCRKDEFKRIFSVSDENADQIFALGEGDISDIVFADEAHHIFQVIDKRPEIPFSMINNIRDKRTLTELVDYAYRNLGPKATVILSDRLKNIGYQYSTEGGLSISIDAMIIPSTKWDILKNAEKQAEKIGGQYTEGLITQGEKYNKVIDIWAKATDDVADEMMKALRVAPVTDSDGNPVLDEEGKPVVEESFNPIFMMADSGARGSKDQMRQLAGMRGLWQNRRAKSLKRPLAPISGKAFPCFNISFPPTVPERVLPIRP